MSGVDRIRRRVFTNLEVRGACEFFQMIVNAGTRSKYPHKSCGLGAHER